MTITVFQIEGRVTPEQEKAYLHLPFTVPAKAQRIEVEYSYTNQINSDPTLLGGNTIDLGLFDERGIQFLEAGFRGWSGSERSKIWVEPSAATPGYLAGALNPGQWNVLLGLYKVAPEGGSYQVVVTITTQDVDPVSPPQPTRTMTGDLPSSTPPAIYSPWLRGELHCHTLHSDGLLSPAQLVGRACSRGLDFIAVSDHNSIACQSELENLASPGLVLLRGVEVTTFKGHFNVWGIPDWVDFRVLRPEDTQAALQFANDHNAVTSCNHPKPFGPGWDYPWVTNYQCIEVWNGPWTGLNEVSLEYWLELLAQGRRIPAVGGSDFHRPGEQAGGRERDLGTPTNWVYVQETPSQASILKAIRAGHVALSEQPDGPFLELTGGENNQFMGGDGVPLPFHGDLSIRLRCRGGSAGDHLRILDQSGVVWDASMTEEEVIQNLAFPIAGRLYLRAELRDSDDRVRALTNPIYFQEPA